MSNKEAIEHDLDTNGAMKFGNIMHQLCPLFVKLESPLMHLKVQEIRLNLPGNLLLMCETSRDLSAFIERMDGLVAAAIQKIDKFYEFCNKNRALLKMEDG